MNKKYKLSTSILTVIVIIFFSIKPSTEIAKAYSMYQDNNNIHLVLDSQLYKEMPQNFRKSSNLSNLQKIKTLNLRGIDKLNISGSNQFSEQNLPLLIKNIDTTFPITIIDTRQESHGFINGLPVSFANATNSSNANLSKEEVLLDEAKRLTEIKLNTPVSFYNHPNITITPTKVMNENQLTGSLSLSYIRIPVTDGKTPSNDMVDYFINVVKSAPKDMWFHFHCKEGIGRTTTFMIMYDMMKNSKEATADEIIERQIALANFDKKKDIAFYSDERIKLLKCFHKYCTEQDNAFNIKWSDWKKGFNCNSTIL
ncbi:phytase [Clostridium sp. SHJSY1]|uniref:fused DSP-PTPase phosphatase/NAD kinase-like protein n=1 Tax=Clostridium sp. SHJSY1 TaxID=2942483 RepID=UPI0028761A74|nr:phytase [Clostridium sp. SHJSY1]